MEHEEIELLTQTVDHFMYFSRLLNLRPDEVAVALHVMLRMLETIALTRGGRAAEAFAGVDARARFLYDHLIHTEGRSL